MCVNGFRQTQLINIRLNLCSLSLWNILDLLQIILPFTSVHLMLNFQHILGVRPLKRHRGLFFLLLLLHLRRPKQLPQLPHMVPIRLPLCQIMLLYCRRHPIFQQCRLGPTAHSAELVDKVHRLDAVEANGGGCRIAAAVVLGRQENARAVADLERKVGLRVGAEYVQQVVVGFIGEGGEAEAAARV